MPTKYELARAQKIAANRELLRSLCIPEAKTFMIKQPIPVIQKPPRKRKAQDSEVEPIAKASRVNVAIDSPSTPLRRSARNAGKLLDYSSEQPSPPPLSYTKKRGLGHKTEPNRPMGKRKYDPYVVG